MDSYNATREVERVVPFPERALSCIIKIRALQDGLLALGLAGSEGHWTPPMLTLQRAIDLLNEARSRGLKRKDIGR